MFVNRSEMYFGFASRMTRIASRAGLLQSVVVQSQQVDTGCIKPLLRRTAQLSSKMTGAYTLGGYAVLFLVALHRFPDTSLKLLESYDVRVAGVLVE